MARTCREVGKLLTILMVLIMVINKGKSDITKDKEECANSLAGLATCLPYVGGQSKAPTPDCCTGLRQVVKDNKKCLCILVKDRNDPSLGLKINATLALSLPVTCHAPASVSDCLALLHLAPNSSEAKVFNDFGKAAAPTSSTPASSDKSTGSSGTSAEMKNDGGKGKRGLIAQMLYGLLLWCFTPHLIF